MSIISVEFIELRLIEIARKYRTLKVEPSPSTRLSHDLGVSGYDSIEFLEEVEEEFNTDLRPLVDSKTIPSLDGKQLSRRKTEEIDVTIREIAEYILETNI